jgi:hypothetical protein
MNWMPAANKRVTLLMLQAYIHCEFRMALRINHSIISICNILNERFLWKYTLFQIVRAPAVLSPYCSTQRKIFVD